jgi:outer membrane protein OmpA-like peptidoglycan-associated protein
MAVDWLADVRIYDADADEGVVGKIVSYCGIALQSRDGQLVAMADTMECETVRENFLKKKLGLTQSDAELDEAIQSVREVMKADRTKNRVTVYYLLARHFGSLNIFGGVAGAAAGAAGLAAAAAGAVSGAADLASDAASGTVNAVSGAAADMASVPLNAVRSGFDDEGTGGGSGWLKWLLLAALLAALLFFLLRSCSGEETTPVAGTETTEAAATAETAVAIPAGAGVTADERNGKPMLTVFFDTGKSDVTADLATAATKVKAYVAANAGAKLGVSGFNDPTGNAAANAELSKKRAQAVGKALEAAGIPAASIELVKPAESTDTTVDNDAARRVEVVVQ